MAVGCLHYPADDVGAVLVGEPDETIALGCGAAFRAARGNGVSTVPSELSVHIRSADFDTGAGILQRFSFQCAGK